MVDNNNNNNDNNDDLFSRILKKRRQDCEMLDESVNNQIVSAFEDDLPVKPPALSSEKIVYLIRYYVESAQDNTNDPATRRSSWNAIKKLLRKIDEQLVVHHQNQKKKQKQKPPPAAAASVSSQQQQQQQQQQRSSTSNGTTTTTTTTAVATNLQTTKTTNWPDNNAAVSGVSEAALAAAAGSKKKAAVQQQQQPQQQQQQKNNNNSSSLFSIAPNAVAAGSAAGAGSSSSHVATAAALFPGGGSTAAARMNQQQQRRQASHPAAAATAISNVPVSPILPRKTTTARAGGGTTGNHPAAAASVPQQLNSVGRSRNPPREKPYAPQQQQQQQQQQVRAAAAAAAATSSSTWQDNRNGLPGTVATQQPRPYAHQPASYQQQRTQNGTRGGSLNIWNQPVQQQGKDVKKWLAPWNSSSTGTKKIYMLKGRHEYACAIDAKIDRPVVRFAQTLPSGQVSASSLERLQEWEPFWELVGPVLIGQTCKPNVPSGEDSRTCFSIRTIVSKELIFPGEDIFNLIPKDEWGVVQTGKKENGRCSLILRMLPLEPNPKKRADCHLWPKGTCLQIDGIARKLEQRKQQVHDYKEWKSICKHLDVTPYIRDPKSETAFDITCYDMDQYILALSICKYRSVDELFKALTSRGSKERIHHMSRQECIRKIEHFTHGSMISLDSDDDEDQKEQPMGKFVFSLKCPISKKLMKAPVRGRNCKHWQCWDLRTFLETNEPTSGQRWRCSSCNNFVSIKDLEVCGLTAEFLEEFARMASPQRDRIEYMSNGTYRLLDPPSIKSGVRKRDAPTTAQGSNKRTAQVTSNFVDLL